MFDPLDEKYRWCIYCEADCWPEPENRKHAQDCPSTTNLWPVTQDDINMQMCCSQCPYEFNLGDFTMCVDFHTGELTTTAIVSSVVCIGCGAAINILGEQYE